MIISRTPLRVSLCGGGSDFEDYYKITPGKVISTTIDKYIYVTVSPRFDGKTHLRYSEIECVNDVSQLKHNLVREALNWAGINNAIEVVTISDVPTNGCGLGSSGSLTVGLLNALSSYSDFEKTKGYLAREACDLEIKRLKAPIGKQDQYAASFGGINFITFKESGEVEIENLLDTAKPDKIKWLQDSSMLFYLGTGRSSSAILEGHKASIKDKMDTLNKQAELTEEFYDWLHTDTKNNSISGELVSRSWKYKKEMTPQATNNRIDMLIDDAMQSGAYGAKVCGAGSSGFLLVICEENKQKFVREALSALTELNFNFEKKGTEVIYES